MKRNIIHIMIALFAIIGTQNIYAQRVLNKQGGDITINGKTNEVVGEESYTNFAITAPSAGNYYINFWVLPTEYADGTFSRYKVLVNGNEAGHIAANCSNWQSLPLENNTKVNLNKGSNIISIVSQIPEVAEVSHISCAKVLSRAQISSEAYTAFLEKARSTDNTIATHETSTIENEGDFIGTYATQSTSSILVRKFHQLPIKYTIARHFTIQAGSEVIITSTSSTKHLVDFFIMNNSTTTPQDLSWLSISERPQANSSVYKTSKRIKIRYTGDYRITLRSFDNEVLGTANWTVKINGTTYSYSNSPIYCSIRDYSIPADGNEYAVMTTYEDIPGGDSPLLYVTGGGAIPGKVVAYNADTPSDEVLEEYADDSLAVTDIYIAETYSIPTKSVWVTLVDPRAPEATCGIKIFRRPSTSTALAYTRSMTSREGEANNLESEMPVNNEKIIIRVVDKTIKVTTAEGIPVDAEVYNMTGVQMDADTQLPVGFYVVKVDGKSEKIVIK